MQAAVEKLDGLKCHLKVTVPADQVNKLYQERLKKAAQTAKVPGFRPGKVPMDVIEKRYGGGIRAEVANELLRSSFEDAVKENKIKVAGSPEIIEVKELKKGQPLEYKAEFETYPEIELKDLNQEKIEKMTAEVTDADIQTMLEKVQKQHADWQEADRAAQGGDRIFIDFEGFIDGELFQGGVAKDFHLELGSKQMIPGFEDGLMDAKAGDDREVKVTFPENYHASDLAGKEALFKIKVHKVEEPKLPPIDDALAGKVGIEGGLEKLKADVRKGMEMELKQALDARLKEQVLEKLMEKNLILIPQALVESEIKHLQQMAISQTANYQKGQKQPRLEDLPREPFEKDAQKRVTLGLLLSEVIQSHDIKMDEDKVRDKISEIASVYQKPDDVVAHYYKNKNMLAEIEAAVIEEQAVAKLIENAVVEEKQSDYTSIMQKEAINE